MKAEENWYDCTITGLTFTLDNREPELWTLYWTEDWTLESIMDSIIGLEFRGQ